jgi:outer membrane lipoprotein carrier protein
MGRSRVTSTFAPRKPSRPFLLAVLALGLVAGGDRPAEEVALEALQKRYDACRDLRARFVQTSEGSGFPTVLQGAVLVQRPGKIRWTYDPPDSRVIVLDGEAIWHYSPKDRQLQIGSLEKGGVDPTALSFLMGEGRLEQEFKPRLVPQEAGAPPALVLDLIPLGDPSFELLRLWLDPKSHELREWVLRDLVGNETRLALSAAECNRGVPPDAFRVEYPEESTEVIDLRQAKPR